MNHILTAALLLLLTLAARTQPVPPVPRHVNLISTVLHSKPCHQRQTIIGGIKLDLRGIYIDSGLLWLVFRGVNHSAIDFRPATMHICIRDIRSLKRRALQERSLTPVIKYEPSVLLADSAVLFCYGLVPRVPGRRQELSIEWMERNGDRRLQLRVSAAAILTARRLPSVAHKN